MTTAAIPFNPMVVSNAAGYFAALSEGLVQGTAFDDPAIRNELVSGVVSNSETIAMFGGLAIQENVPASPGYNVLNGNLLRAAGLTTYTGFTVFDQAHNGNTTPQSPVPGYGSGQTINFYRKGSGARIAVAASASLGAQVDGNIISQNVSWDFVNHVLVPYSPAFAGATISAATWASTGGGQATFTVNTDYTALLNAGDIINVSGVVSTGNTTDGYNGQLEVVSVTDSTHVVAKVPRATTPGTYASGGAIAAGGGAFPVQVLSFQPTNNKIVTRNSTTGALTWNNNGPAAVILI